MSGDLVQLDRRSLDSTNTGVRKRRKSDNSWSMSYGDMVTALLCFFIIFYAIEKQIEKRNVSAIQGYGPVEEGILSEHTDSKIDTEYDYMIERLEQIENIQIFKTSSFVDIYFQKVVFFEKGSYEVTSEGKQLIDQVLHKLTDISGKYYLEIQGHADKTPVANKKERWWKTNIELSVLRALNIHHYLTEKGIDKDYLAVAGFGHNKSINPELDAAMDFDRRISLRLQMVK